MKKHPFFFLLAILFCNSSFAQTIHPGFPFDLHERVSFCDFSSDGKSILLGSREGGSVWDINSGKFLLRLTGTDEGLSNGVFTPDGKMVVSTGVEENKIRLWDIKTGSLLKAIDGEKEFRYFKILVSADSKYLVAQCYDANVSDKNSEIHFFELPSLKNVKKIKLKIGRQFVGLAKDGNQVSYVEQSGPSKAIVKTIAFASLSSSGQTVLKNFPLPDPYIMGVQLSSGLDTVAVVYSNDGSLVLQTILTKSGAKLKEIRTGGTGRISSDWKFFYSEKSDSVSVTSLKTSKSETFQNPIVEDLPYSSGDVFPDHRGNQFAVSFKDQIIVYSVEDRATGPLTLPQMKLSIVPGSLDYDSKPMSIFNDLNEVYVWGGNRTLKIDKEGIPHPVEFDSTIIVLQSGHQNRFDMVPENDGGVYRSVTITSAEDPKRKYKVDIGLSGIPICSQDINDSEKLILTSAYDSRLNFRIWDNKGNELVNFQTIDSVNWIAISPSGLFDASPEIFDKLYFIDGLTVLDFNKLKPRYYEPGLVGKVLRGTVLREVK